MGQLLANLKLGQKFALLGLLMSLSSRRNYSSRP